MKRIACVVGVLALVVVVLVGERLIANATTCDDTAAKLETDVAKVNKDYAEKFEEYRAKEDPNSVGKTWGEAEYKKLRRAYIREVSEIYAKHKKPLPFWLWS